MAELGKMAYCRKEMVMAGAPGTPDVCEVCQGRECLMGHIDPTQRFGVKEYLRPPLAAFAAEMEAKLRKNDHKTHWRKLPIEALVKLMDIERQELQVALEHFGPAEARNELIDVANFAMMLYDRLESVK